VESGLTVGVLGCVDCAHRFSVGALVDLSKGWMSQELDFLLCGAVEKSRSILRSRRSSDVSSRADGFSARMKQRLPVLAGHCVDFVVPTLRTPRSVGQPVS
jgi:hypothetical protein